MFAVSFREEIFEFIEKKTAELKPTALDVSHQNTMKLIF